MNSESSTYLSFLICIFKDTVTECQLLSTHFGETELCTGSTHAVLCKIQFVPVPKDGTEAIKIPSRKAIEAYFMMQFVGTAGCLDSKVTGSTKDGPLNGGQGVLGDASGTSLDRLIGQRGYPFDAPLFTGKGPDRVSMQSNVLPNTF